MKRAKADSIAHAAATRVRRGGDDRLWAYADFQGVGRTALAAAQSRLGWAGKLMRVRRSVYYRPKRTVFGLSKPDPAALAGAILRARGEARLPSGIGAYSRLGLTTQVSGRWGYPLRTGLTRQSSRTESTCAWGPRLTNGWWTRPPCRAPRTTRTRSSGTPWS